jgi:inosine-uridine nucleoside N-ribohydrolase
LGPFTNLAACHEMDSGALQQAASIILLGGSRGRGNITPFAEFNVFADPEAAQILLESGLSNITLVPLDICEQVVLTRAKLRDAAEKSNTAMGWFLDYIHQHYMTYYYNETKKLGMDPVDGCYPHDSIAVAAALRPDLFAFETAHVQVMTEANAELGKTIFDFSPYGRVQVATAVDHERLLDVLLNSVFAVQELAGKSKSDEETIKDLSCFYPGSRHVERPHMHS